MDDPGAPHRGKNGYVTHIGNDFFAWFGSTPSKSRINFLELLHAGTIRYQVNAAALAYLHEQGLAQAVCHQLHLHRVPDLTTPAAWQPQLERLGITGERHRHIATEGALLGALLDKPDFNPALAIISDGAGQFAILQHGLCWIHAERLIHKLIPMNDVQRAAVAQVRAQLWDFYAALKAYRLHPDEQRIEPLQARFTEIFTQRAPYATLNGSLKRIHQHKSDMLRILQRPEVPLHTNGSETDIRDYVKKKQGQRRHPQRLGASMSRRLHQLEENLPKARHLILGLPDRSRLPNSLHPASP